MHTQTLDSFPTPASAKTPVVIVQQLESARVLIEQRFLDAGGRLAESLDLVGRLIESLDRLGVTLNTESVSDTTDDLLSTASGLNALPDAQKGRVAYFGRLQSASATLESDIGDMRTTMRYLRAFALNVKITAGSTAHASDEFADFAERMCDQLDLGVRQLDALADQLKALDTQLQQALGFERGLDGKYQTLIPAVPDQLTVDARAINAHHTRIAQVATSVAAIARGIQTKVGKALMAMQIGDITRQRIEHVQFGIEVVERATEAWDISEDARDRGRRRILHMLAEQMADIANDFGAEAAKVNQGLSGMAADTAQMVVIQDLSGSGGDAGLRALEAGLARAGLLVGDVTAAMTNADRIRSETASAVEALAQRVDAIQGVKRDIQQMAINSSLRCNRLGEIGKPLSVIAIELSSHAGQLETAADHTLGSLSALAGIANEPDADASSNDAVDAGRLDGVRGRLRQAADVVENDLAGLGSQGEVAAKSLALAADQLGLKEDLGDALHTAAIALAEVAGPVVTDVADIASDLEAAMDEIARCYTMARERVIHAAHSVSSEASDEVEPASEVQPAEEFDDILF